MHLSKTLPILFISCLLSQIGICQTSEQLSKKRVYRKPNRKDSITIEIYENTRPRLAYNIKRDTVKKEALDTALQRKIKTFTDTGDAAFAYMLEYKYKLIKTVKGQTISVPTYHPPCDLDRQSQYILELPLYEDGTFDSTLPMVNKYKTAMGQEVPENIRNDERKVRKYRDSLDVVFQKHNDSIFTARRQILKTLAQKTMTDSGIIAIQKQKGQQYRVWMDGQLYKDWQPVNHTEHNRIADNYYKLIVIHPCAHYYSIDVRDKYNGQQNNVIGSAPRISILGIYPYNKKAAIEKVLNTIQKVDANTILQFPTINWQQYGNNSLYDTFKIDNKPYIVPTFLDIPSSQKHLLFLMEEPQNGMSYEYRLVQEDNPDDSTTAWQNNGRNNLIQLNSLATGDYRFQVRYAGFHNSPIGTYLLTIRSAWYQTDFIKGMLSGIAIGLLILFIIKKVKKQKQLQKEVQQKMASLQLQAYRSQLNPHFIFNALSSIQNLVNKNDNEKANEYLTDFSLLLRMTLDQQKAEYWTLQDEVSLLNKYLQLEQLRFSFAYNIQLPDNFVAENIMFPSMLLQPVVENAVKHGISSYSDKGILIITLTQKNNDLNIAIKDNGKGFNEQLVRDDHHGIRLTRERITLLNEINKEQKIEMNISSNNNGTTVSFHFYNYLHA